MSRLPSNALGARKNFPPTETTVTGRGQPERWTETDRDGNPLKERDATISSSELVLVPREPTPEMYAAAEREWDGRISARIAGVWQAMIDAAQEVNFKGEEN